MYIVEAFASHERKYFDCGEETLNRYLHERATQDIKRKLNQVFVIREDSGNQMLGYYTLAATTIEAQKLPPEHVKRLPKYPIPAALLGKLAIDKNWHGKGLGKLMVANAVRRVQNLEKEIGIHVLVVDPMTDALVDFYTSMGFLHFSPERRLFLFMDSLKE